VHVPGTYFLTDSTLGCWKTADDTCRRPSTADNKALHKLKSYKKKSKKNKNKY